MPWWVTLAASLLTALLSGGGIAALLLHLRERVRVAAETDNIEANVTDINWQRFQREINRLDKKVREQGDRISQLERQVGECEEERARLQAENIMLRSANEARGEIRQRAAQIVAADRLETGQ